MKKFIASLVFGLLCAGLHAQNVPAAVQRKTDGTNELTSSINAGSGVTIGIHTGGTFRFDSGAAFAGSASAFRTAIGAGTSDFDGAFSSLTGKPTTLAGYGITDPIVLTSGSYANPAWITSLAWSKLTGTPTTLAGYGITDPVVTTAGSYANPAWITSLADSKLTGAYTASGQTLATSRILGRTTAATGAAEELTASAVLDLVGATRGSVLYRGASGWSILAPGTSGYVLASGGAGADPSYVAQTGGGGGTWGSITGTLSAQTDLQTALDAKQPLAAKLTALGAMSWGANSIIYSPTSSTVGVITTGNSGVLVTSGAGVPSIGTDLPTAVTIGGGAIYRAGGTDVAVADGGTGLSSGTSGGILGFTASGTIASSVALTQNALILGGGAGATPTPLGSLGTTTTVLHGNAIGAPTFGAVSLTADVSGILPSANGGTNNAFVAIVGPASTVKTYTGPNADATLLTDNAAVTVAQGGTGRATSTTAYGLLAAGTTATGAQQTLAAGATTDLLVGGGASALPVWTTATGSGAPVRATSPTLVTPTIGAATATSINGNTLTAGTWTLTGVAAKTLTFNNSITLAGTDAQTYTFPTTSATLARTDAANSFTGIQSMTSPDITTSITTPTASFTAWAGATTLLTIGGTGASASMFAPSTLDATSSTTGAIRTSGGISAAKALNIGTTITGGGNFSIGTSNSATVGTIELGAASDTTIARVGAGSISVEGSTVFQANTKTDVLQAAMFAADAGANDTYTITLSPAITAYVTGVHYYFKANTANTGAASININAVGAKTIVKPAGGITTALADNDIRAGQWVDLVYDGTNMQMVSLLGNAPAGSGTVTVVGAGSLTSTAFMTGGGSQASQTPSATSTLDSSGNAVFAGTATATQFIGSGTTPGAMSLSAGTGSISALPLNSAGWAAPATGGTSYLIKPPATITAGIPILAAPATADGVNESAMTMLTTTGSGTVAVLQTSPTLITPLLGTPTSGTLTNCTGLPISGLVASTSTALGVGSIELGAASDTTIARVSAGVISVEGVTVDTISATNTLTNKRISARITTISSSATPTINTDNCDVVTITALAAAITSMTTNLTGSPVNFDQLEIRILDNGTARAITWGASFGSGTATLPTTTTVNKALSCYFEYDSVQSKWMLQATGSYP